MDYKNLANDLGADQRTMSNYVLSLETALLCQKLYNFSSNLLTSEKKIKRLYLSNTAFTAALEPRVDYSLLVEQYFVNRLHGRFFWKDPQKREVDLISTENDVILPLEVKIRKKVDKRDLRGMFKFMERYHLNRGLLITLDTDEVYEKNGKKIIALPYWRYWTLIKLRAINAPVWGRDWCTTSSPIGLARLPTQPFQWDNPPPSRQRSRQAGDRRSCSRA
ncbi:MAG: hypothetical protein K9J81_07080 [Desulfohalobiaceae bacterium]|nr:hypothetical protein [Desulfohalobiaceae bacterium]